MTPELLRTGAECVASNSLGRNTTTIFLELGKGLVLRHGRHGHERVLFLTPPNPFHHSPDSSRSTGLSTSTVSPSVRANGTSTGKQSWHKSRVMAGQSPPALTLPPGTLFRKVSRGPSSISPGLWSSGVEGLGGVGHGGVRAAWGWE